MSEPTPAPGAEISAREAMRLPGGSAIVKVANSNGPVTSVSALIKSAGGYFDGVRPSMLAAFDVNDRFRVLYMGQQPCPPEGTNHE